MICEKCSERFFLKTFTLEEIQSSNPWNKQKKMELIYLFETGN